MRACALSVLCVCVCVCEKWSTFKYFSGNRWALSHKISFEIWANWTSDLLFFLTLIFLFCELCVCAHTCVWHCVQFCTFNVCSPVQIPFHISTCGRCCWRFCIVSPATRTWRDLYSPSCLWCSSCSRQVFHSQESSTFLYTYMYPSYWVNTTTLLLIVIPVEMRSCIRLHLVTVAGDLHIRGACLTTGYLQSCAKMWVIVTVAVKCTVLLSSDIVL